MIYIESFTAGYFQFSRFQAQLVKNRSVDVCYIMSIFDSMEPNFIRRTVRDTTFNSATGHPD